MSLSRTDGVPSSAVGGYSDDNSGEYGDGTLHTPVQPDNREAIELISQNGENANTMQRESPQATPSQQRQQSQSLNQATSPRTQRSTNLNNGDNHSRNTKKNTRAAIKIASLNMRGRGRDKWLHINQIMKEKKIGILALQETHLTDIQTENIQNLFCKRLVIHSSIDTNSSNSKGVAIVFNKEITNTKDIHPTVLIPGRAIQITTQWHTNQTLNLLAIYAPNHPTENASFWTEINEKRNQMNLPKPDIMLGDFNIVEDSIDRMPCHPDNLSATEALYSLRTEWHLIDGWRHTNPNTKAYSFLQKASGAQSRIDRIYLTNALQKVSYEWTIDPPGIETDHLLIATKISSPRSPYVGKGRWVLPAYALEEKALIEKVQKLGLTLEKEIDNNKSHRNDQKNPQTLFKSFKEEIVKEARNFLKKKIPKLDTKIRNLKKDIEKINNDTTMEEEEKCLNSMYIQEELNSLENKRHTNQRLNMEARNRLEGETISKYWTQISKEKTPRDTINALKYPNSTPPQYEFKSLKMTNLAKEHHNTLQQTNNPETTPEFQQVTTEILENIKKKASPEEQDNLKIAITEEDVQNSIESQPNGKAAGLDGLPVELWKVLNNQAKGKKENTSNKTNIVKILTSVYNDIEIYGVSPLTNFAEGWLCPLYKKGDVREIANYRPITILNTDYKIFTKIMTNKLAPIANNLIHKNQAAFLPNRNIAEQIKTAKLLINYAEINEEDGAIIALDQEKAYDKISHKYLWQTLKKFNIPEEYVKIIRSLYEHAQTTVILNGELSEPFNITRGVRQGDPLSCLLFNLAIEPLSQMLHNSTLQGFQIQGMEENLKVSLFADDTTVFLSHTDKFSDLQNILDRWCKASGAKFNTAKTEIIPIGTKEFRQNLINTRKMNHEQQEFPKEIHIAKDGEPVRMLGAWLGNCLDQPGIWTNTMDKIEKSLSNWGNSHPTLEGRRLIVQMVIAGMTQYLTKVQGMPKEVENKLIKLTRTFMWKSEAIPPINSKTLNLPHKKGGKKVLDITARNKAIQLMWLKSYLTDQVTRPNWAYIADDIIRKNILMNGKSIPQILRKNPFIQAWKPNTNKLPYDLKEMMRVAKEFKVQIHTLKPTKELKEELPLWSHPNANDFLRLSITQKEAKCMQTNHNIQTVGDAYTLSKNANDTHRPRKDCTCPKCTEMKEHHCKNPHKCQKMAQKLINTITPIWNPEENNPEDNLDLTPRRKKRNERAEMNNQAITFDPNVKLNIKQDIFRVFTDPNIIITKTANRPAPTPPNNCITIYTDGSCLNNGQENAQAGSGIWYEHNHPLNKALRVPGKNQTNQAGELYAVMQAIKSTPLNTPVLIKSDSKYVINGLTKHLQKWEDRGWIGIANKNLFKALIAQLRQRACKTEFQWIKGHDGNEGNEEADKLAALGAKKTEVQESNEEIPDNFNLTGAKLQAMTQALLYKGITQQKAYKMRTSTLIMLDITRWAIADINQNPPSDECIWGSLKDKALTKQTRDFLWKNIHNAYKVGQYWYNIPEHEHKAKCIKCDTEESMEHILTDCDEPEQQTIWHLAEQLWQRKYENWPTITHGTIMGCGTTSFRNRKGELNTAKNRLFRILVSESAYLIWKLRCERRITHEDDQDFHHSKTEIHNRWLATINKRLIMDQLHTDQKRFKKKAIKKDKVLKTWSGLLLREENLPEDWKRQSGVLVGIASLRPPGRRREC